jgi:hypothetical protein
METVGSVEDLATHYVADTEVLLHENLQDFLIVGKQVRAKLFISFNS